MLPVLPVILCCSGHDPTGGAGVQADIEAIHAQGAHAATLITTLTVQDSRNVQSLHPLSCAVLRSQADAVFADLPIRAIKIGLIGATEIAGLLADLLCEHRDIPVVLDPVLSAGGGTSLADPGLVEQIRERLLPRCRVITPNLAEAQRLSGETDPAECAVRLRAAGAGWVLITGGDANTDEVENHLFGADGTHQVWRWPRLPGSYHGSGCTLAAALAARLALGESVPVASEQAQRYTQRALAHAHAPGRGQAFPRR